MRVMMMTVRFMPLMIMPLVHPNDVFGARIIGSIVCRHFKTTGHLNHDAHSLLARKGVKLTSNAHALERRHQVEEDSNKEVRKI